jgi:hypothetical protein
VLCGARPAAIRYGSGKKVKKKKKKPKEKRKKKLRKGKKLNLEMGKTQV